MAYKQNNPLSRKSNSTPLRHNVRNSAGDSWRHVHQKNGVIKTLTGKLIRGSEDFNKRTNRAVRDERTDTKRLPDGSRATSENYAREYARQLADYYNKGYVTGGQFLAQEFDKTKGKLNLFKKGKLVDYKGGEKSINLPGMYNMTAAEAKNIIVPETQYTEDNIYEMMVQGGGLVSIVDGKIVAGNPNESKYQVSDADWDDADERISKNRGVYGNTNIQANKFKEGYVPEGYMDERSTTKVDPNRKYTVKELLELRKQKNEKFLKDNPVDPNAVVNTTKVDPNRRLSVKELLERRKQKSNSAINRVMGNSPLNTGHETDERSNQTFNLQEGYDYQDPVITVTEGEWVDDPNNPGQQMRVITTDESITGERKNLNPGGLGQGQAVEWTQLKEDICSGRKKGDTSICDDTQNISNSVTEYRPIESTTTDIEEEITTTEVEEPEPELVDINFDLGQGSIKRNDFSIDLPDVNLPSLGLDQLNILKKKCGGCKQRGLIQRAILALGGGI
jgi:hypothetical protein